MWLHTLACKHSSCSVCQSVTACVLLSLSEGVSLLSRTPLDLLYHLIATSVVVSDLALYATVPFLAYSLYMKVFYNR